MSTRNLLVCEVLWSAEPPTYEVRTPGRGPSDDYEPGDCLGVFDTLADALAFVDGVKPSDKGGGND